MIKKGAARKRNKYFIIICDSQLELSLNDAKV